MRFAVGSGREISDELLEEKGINRRDFLKFCTAIAVTMGLAPSFAPKIAQALTNGKRPSVVYLHTAECTGCSEALLRTYKPFFDALIFDVISLDYHETIMAAAGIAAEEALEQAIHNPDGFICMVEGAIPTGLDGKYGYVGGKTMLDMCKEILPKAKLVIANGTCAAFGGIQAAAPNPTEAKSVAAVFPDLKVINVAGCPPNPLNMIGTITYYLQNKSAPALDDNGRPEIFYGQSVHDLCERLPHFEAGEFAPSFESEEAKKGWCLYELGCKGPMTMNNCPKVLFNDINWPVRAGHPCIGCSEPNFWDELSPFYEN